MGFSASSKSAKLSTLLGKDINFFHDRLSQAIVGLTALAVNRELPALYKNALKRALGSIINFAGSLANAAAAGQMSVFSSPTIAPSGMYSHGIGFGVGFSRAPGGGTMTLSGTYYKLLGGFE
ncbi:MAG: hypothetical protein AAB834_01665 [Patescibacteria group bacterium]